MRPKLIDFCANKKLHRLALFSDGGRRDARACCHTGSRSREHRKGSRREARSLPRRIRSETRRGGGARGGNPRGGRR
eukprot:scaffold662045_cov36-Prasinocladus_malaysianus.AAC.1